MRATALSLVVALAACGDVTPVSINGETGSSESSSEAEGGVDGSSGAPVGECGNGVLDLGEECDDAQNGDNDDDCTDACNTPRCGDNFVQASLAEECDRGPDGDDDCTTECEATLAPAWSKRRRGDNGGDDDGRGIAIDSAGNVAVAGALNLLGNGTDFVVWMFAPDGTELWRRDYNGEVANSQDEAGGVAFDGDEPVVAGFLTMPGEARNAFVVKLDAAGDERWRYVYNGPGDFDDEARAIAVDIDGRAVITGYDFDDPFAPRLLYVGLDRDGEERFVGANAGDPTLFHRGSDVAFDSEGNAYIAGLLDDDNYVVKLSPAGDELWSVSFHTVFGDLFDEARTVGVTPDDEILVGGSNQNGYVRRFTSAGEEVWSQVYEGMEGALVSIATDGERFAAGGRVTATFQGSTPWLRLLESDGTTVWLKRGTGANTTGRLRDIAFGPGGEIATVGTIFSGLDRDDVWIRKYAR